MAVQLLQLHRTVSQPLLARMAIAKQFLIPDQRSLAYMAAIDCFEIWQLLGTRATGISRQNCEAGSQDFLVGTVRTATASYALQWQIGTNDSESERIHTLH